LSANLEAEQEVRFVDKQTEQVVEEQLAG